MRPKRIRPTRRTKPRRKPASSLRSGLINRASPRPTSSSPPPSHPPSPRRKRPLLPSRRTGSPGSKDPALSIEEWLSLQLPTCTPSARPSRSSAQDETSPPPPYNSYQFYQDLPQYSDSFYLPPDFHHTHQPTFDLSSAAFPPVDTTSLFYDDSPPDTSLTAGSNTSNTALSSLSDSSYQDQIIGYSGPTTQQQHTSCPTILHPHSLVPVPVTAAEPDLDPIDSLLSSPELSEELNLLASPGVNSLAEPSEIEFPPMPSVSSSASSRAAAAAPPKEAPNRVKKRELNTLAARRYRQRRVDRMNQLEEELAAIKRERDELKMRVSKLEGETEALRSMVRSQK
ncbi:hypothetical protein AbraIFM66950_012051 [Aspergillus brasiliensis]|nr:hypothetical protein AbraIFM66950_012051 [Aspergillus brasiliensis]